jgi:hypothetical protein
LLQASIGGARADQGGARGRSDDEHGRCSDSAGTGGAGLGVAGGVGSDDRHRQRGLGRHRLGWRLGARGPRRSGGDVARGAAALGATATGGRNNRHRQVLRRVSVDRSEFSLSVSGEEGKGRRGLLYPTPLVPVGGFNRD